MHRSSTYKSPFLREPPATFTSGSGSAARSSGRGATCPVRRRKLRPAAARCNLQEAVPWGLLPSLEWRPRHLAIAITARVPGGRGCGGHLCGRRWEGRQRLRRGRAGAGQAAGASAASRGVAGVRGVGRRRRWRWRMREQGTPLAAGGCCSWSRGILGEWEG